MPSSPPLAYREPVCASANTDRLTPTLPAAAACAGLTLEEPARTQLRAHTLSLSVGNVL